MFDSPFFFACYQRSAATRSGELRNCVFSAKIKFLAENKREFCTFLAISCNRCCAMPIYATGFLSKSLYG